MEIKRLIQTLGEQVGADSACEVCHGTGVHLMTCYVAGTPVERCDQCKVFGDDEVCGEHVRKKLKGVADAATSK